MLKDECEIGDRVYKELSRLVRGGRRFWLFFLKDDECQTPASPLTTPYEWGNIRYHNVMYCVMGG